MRKSLFLAVTIPVAALTLAACSSQGGNQSGKTEEAEQGPLDEYLSVLWEGQDWTQERYDAENLQREELIAECMKKEGFEYTPNTETGGVVLTSDTTEGPEWGTVEFAETYGYGIIDWPGADAVEEESEVEYVDPNEDYVNSLSTSEQEAYYTTLYGATDETVYDDEDYEYNWEDNGCYGWADNEINGQDKILQAWEDPEFEDLIASIETFSSDISATTADSELDAAWVSCMEDAGYTGFSVRSDAQDSMFIKQDELYSSTSDSDEWVEPSEEAKQAFQEEEIALATADYKCAEKVNYDEIQQKAYFEAQQEFVDEHKAELEAFAAKYGQTSQS